MRIAKRMQRKPSPPKQLLFIDEIHLMTGSTAFSSAMQKWQSYSRRPNAEVFIATQSIMPSNSGKRLRFLGSTKRADGSNLKPAPKRFIPAQFHRRGKQGKAP